MLYRWRNAASAVFKWLNRVWDDSNFIAVGSEKLQNATRQSSPFPPSHLGDVGNVVPGREGRFRDAREPGAVDRREHEIDFANSEFGIMGRGVCSLGRSRA